MELQDWEAGFRLRTEHAGYARIIWKNCFRQKLAITLWRTISYSQKSGPAVMRIMRAIHQNPARHQQPNAHARMEQKTAAARKTAATAGRNMTYVAHTAPMDMRIMRAPLRSKAFGIDGCADQRTCSL